MTDAKYNVKANIEVTGGKRAEQAVTGITGRLVEVQQRLERVNKAAPPAIRSMLGLGLGYIGINTLVGSMQRAISSTMEYTSALEGTRTALATVLNVASEGAVSYASAAHIGDTVFNQLKQDAITSVGTARDLFGIYQGIVGPIMQAGYGLETVRRLTNSTVAAASVLGVDFTQANRDVQMMARGAAGVDVKLFSMLRATGAIKEDAQAFNQLTQADRIAKIDAALGKFAPAAERYAKSWAGVTSTFVDVRNEMSRSAIQPVLDAAARGLGRLNEALIRSFPALSQRFERWGESFGSRIESMFTRLARGVDYITAHWDEIAQKMQLAMKAAAVLGTAKAAAGAVMGAAAFLPQAGGGMAMLAQAGSVVMPIIAPLIGPALMLLAALAGRWREVTSVVVQTVGPFLAQLWDLGAAVVGSIMPILQMFGEGPLLVIVGLFAALVPVATLLVGVLRWLFDWVKTLAEAGYVWLKPGFDIMWQAIEDFAGWLMELANKVLGWLGMHSPDVVLGRRRAGDHSFDMMAHPEGFDAVTGKGTFDAGMAIKVPSGRQQTNIDMRGSKIEVKQDFREADPDRVLVQMMGAIAKQSVMRVQTGFMPAAVR